MVYVRLDELLMDSGTDADRHDNSTVSGSRTIMSGLSIGSRGGTEIK